MQKYCNLDNYANCHFFRQKIHYCINLQSLVAFYSMVPYRTRSGTEVIHLISNNVEKGFASQSRDFRG